MADAGVSVSRIGASLAHSMVLGRERGSKMKAALLVIVASLLVGTACAEDADRGPYARIAILRPNDGDTVDFETGYIRHLEWHRQAADTWVWYGWTVTFGERQRWFVYASFGHSAASVDQVVNPAEDERDNISNVTPHAQYLGNGLYEYLPALSRGNGEPQPTARLELTTVDLHSGAEAAFENALRAKQSSLQHETLWYRMVAGGAAPRYVRLRSQANLSGFLAALDEQALPEKTKELVAKTTIEILTLRPTMSYGITQPTR
jgi:hypothetical protein